MRITMSDALARDGDEQARQEALERYSILDTPPERAFDNVVHLAARLLRVPMAAISFIDRDRQWFKARIGVAADETPRSISFCDHTIRADDVVVVADATVDDRFKDNPYVLGEPGIRFYAAAPLKTRDGFRLGTLCVFDCALHPDYNDQHTSVLSLLASVVVEMMEMRIGAQKLIEELESRRRIENRLRLLQAITRACADSQDFETALVAVLRLISDHLGADGAQVWSLDPGMPRCELDAAYVAPGSGLEKFMEHMGKATLTPENSVVGQTIAQQRVRAVVNSPEADLSRLPYARIALDHGVLSFVSLPFRGVRTGFSLCFLFRKIHPDLARVKELIRDISSEIQIVLARKEAEGRLREAETMEAVGQLTAGVAHVLNNILTVIVGNLDYALTVPGIPESAMRYLSRSVDASTRATGFVDQLLAFSRRQHLHIRSIDVSQQVEELVPELCGTIIADATLHTDLAPDLWPVRADPHPFDQAIKSMVENAAAASARSVMISARNVTFDEANARRLEILSGDYVVITIADDGKGMARPVAARAFEPFYTTKDPAIHTGLGLSQVYGFVRQSHGAIELDSKLGGGTRINMILPRAKAAG